MVWHGSRVIEKRVQWKSVSCCTLLRAALLPNSWKKGVSSKGVQQSAFTTVFSWLSCRQIKLPQPIKVIGWFLKRFSVNVKKKCQKIWRWPSRRMKIWHKYNINLVIIFAWKWFLNHDYFGWYGLVNVWFWWFWPWPNIMETCSKLALCIYFLW